ncbi:Kunitz/Bovine pancreatic trypsin inhibitor domain protein [Teladorsagia circumcincta]|uniref:Kunitz/Bovine pancreatic trypsin inhibitor domain protein n=1 Tax=Teladorsagia circumcincta TaxID=45464 RepID=A0A2G9U8P5_TELCI|nr:Kunitz/Bovine pancreatic trypsin inhibitor domain protein [Teladorsagia circumcincta]
MIAGFYIQVIREVALAEHLEAAEYFYDVKRARCFPFEYSGCGGNANNFPSITECKQKCMPDKAESRDCGGKKLVEYFYDVKRARCFPFEYTGCGGNANNFPSVTECKQKCMPDKAESRDCGGKKLVENFASSAQSESFAAFSKHHRSEKKENKIDRPNPGTT